MNNKIDHKKQKTEIVCMYNSNEKLIQLLFNRLDKAITASSNNVKIHNYINTSENEDVIEEFGLLYNFEILVFNTETGKEKDRLQGFFEVDQMVEFLDEHSNQNLSEVI